MKRANRRTKGAVSAQRRRVRRCVLSRERLRVKRGGKLGRLLGLRGKLVMMVVTAPNNFSLENHDVRQATLSALQALRGYSRKKGIGVILDFTFVERITAAGAVLLMAEIDRALAGLTVIQARRSRHHIVDQVLQQIGVYEKLGIQCETPPGDDSVIHWRQASGVLSDGQKGGGLLENYEGRLADGIRKGLYAGIIEAMTNTLHHAYDGQIGEQLKHQIGKRWWMLSQEKDGNLSVAICDLGIGIPRSLPRSKSFSFSDVKALWRNLRLDGSDASAIQVALKLGTTRTRLKGRGKGLADIVEAVDLSESGGVFISSNKGVFTSHNGKVRAHNHTHSIRGTLIYWVVPIGETGQLNGG